MAERIETAVQISTLSSFLLGFLPLFFWTGGKLAEHDIALGLSVIFEIGIVTATIQFIRKSTQPLINAME